MDFLFSFLIYFGELLIGPVVFLIGYLLAKWFAPENRFEFGFGFFLIVGILLYYFDI